MRTIFSHPAVFKELDKICDAKSYHRCVCAILDLMKYPEHNSRRLEVSAQQGRMFLRLSAVDRQLLFSGNFSCGVGCV